ncbi:hypothetical protein JCGZ_21650 [Jatropha curcas]|uniref:Fe2OG dioxygenase domain-containing protein n=1 Tax=Jatropha curcas TaxID=180498 RepID=A0A067JNV5_JATCU|nr:protein SRG1-like [Jatropha curcas]KDP21179.1 hypothetical protein JCGZ_21650 [Jatropha curcas]
MASSSHLGNSLDENFQAAISVQELIKKPILSVPQNYVQSDQQSFDSASFPISLPIIDLKLLLSTDSELEKLHSTCKEWGIFQLVNHEISSLLMENLKNDIEEFYKLPLEEKMKYTIRPDGDVEGYGTASRLRGKLDWGDRFYLITNPIHRRKPHLLPELPSSLRNNLESYILELQKLSRKLFGYLAEALKIDEKEMEDMFDDGMQSIRMTYYPPCPQPELVVGITPHSDATGLTILNQVNGVDGLHIKKDGKWSPVTFFPNSLVVNVGDILEILSNGRYNSIEHKVVVNSEKERISIAFFVNPKVEAEVGPVMSLINPDNPPIFKRVGMEQYFKEFFSRKLNGKSFLEHMKINLAHPAN